MWKKLPAMADNSKDQNDEMARKLAPKGKRKVKTGCRTCKVRKVKCDEGRPACRRCVSTGRVCDGYGIWGGGGNAYHERSYTTTSKSTSTQILAKSQPQSRDEFTCFGFSSRTKVPRKMSPLGNITTEELGYLEWYTRRSAPKLPGIFNSGFWNTLVMQSCLHEPAILHAVVALSAIHKCEHAHSSRVIPHEAEQFALREYTKAISHLQQQCSDKSKESRRVAMITCLIFVCFEFLRSHYRTGFAHLASGLKLLKETQAHTGQPAGPWMILHPSPDTIDTTIFETFASMHVQAELLGQRVRDLKIILHTTDTETIGDTFPSMDHARMALDKVLHGVLLFYESRCESISMGRSSRTPLAIDAQRRAQAALWSWHETYKRTTRGFPKPSHLSQKDIFAYKLLRVYHLMAGILTDTSLVPTSELRFDTYTSEFAKMVRKVKELRGVVEGLQNNRPGWDASVRSMMELHFDFAGRSTSDMGCIPPLFFVAVKCRSHNIRHAAISILKSMDHKEGIWDSKLAAAFTEEVVRLEEHGFYDSMGTPTSICDDQESVTDPELLDKDLPPLPESYRLPGVEAILPDNSSEKIKLAYKKFQDDGSSKTAVHEYDAATNRWV